MIEHHISLLLQSGLPDLRQSLHHMVEGYSIEELLDAISHLNEMQAGIAINGIEKDQSPINT